MNDLNSNLEKAIRELSVREGEYAKAVENAACIDADYRIAKALAFLRADGTDKTREYEAVVKCGELLKERDAAIAYRDLMREKLIDVRAALSARQSILSAAVKVHDLTKNMTA